MLTYKPATGEQYDEFLQLLQQEAADYLERTMELMQMTLEQARHLFETVGQVYGIYQDDKLAGFYWIEEREQVLHLHGLALKKEFQRKGIGTQVLAMLEAGYWGRMQAIELGVHESNAGARALYEKRGYQTVKRLDDLGFYIMQRPMRTKEPGMQKYDHVAFQVSNMDAAIQFYVGRLGFTLSSRAVNTDEGEDYAFLTLGDLRLELIQDLHTIYQKPHVKPPYCPHLAIETDDMAQAVAHLKERGVSIIRGPLEVAGEETWVYFVDPDNNVLEYIQWYKKK